MMTPIRALFALAPAVAALVLAPLASAADPQAEARAVIQSTVDEVIAILNDDARDSAARREAIEAVAEERFDFRTMSKLVLAKNWKRLSKEQQGEFVTQFTEYLANDYGSRIERYEQEQVDIVGERVAKRGDVTVKTKIVGGANNDAEVDYRMRNRDEGWKIIDVVIEGISLVANFRDQFRDVMGKEGPVTLIDKLKEKNASHGA
jgi:phospholipid transport system substrate-binding protein